MRKLICKSPLIVLSCAVVFNIKLYKWIFFDFGKIVYIDGIYYHELGMILHKVNHVNSLLNWNLDSASLSLSSSYSLCLSHNSPFFLLHFGFSSPVVGCLECRLLVWIPFYICRLVYEVSVSVLFCFESQHQKHSVLHQVGAQQKQAEWLSMITYVFGLFIQFLMLCFIQYENML